MKLILTTPSSSAGLKRQSKTASRLCGTSERVPGPSCASRHSYSVPAAFLISLSRSPSRTYKALSVTSSWTAPCAALPIASPIVLHVKTSRWPEPLPVMARSEEHTSELQSLMRISYAVFCLKKKNQTNYIKNEYDSTSCPTHSHKHNQHQQNHYLHMRQNQI